jgi:hypothetical protein
MDTRVEGIRLRPSGGLGRDGLRALVMAFFIGLVASVAGVAGFGTDERGPLGILAWSLISVGGLLCMVSLVLMGLFSRWLGRPSVLTPQGILLPGFPRRRLVAWERIDRCEVRRGEGGITLLAAWLKEGRSSEERFPLWLGALPAGEDTERDILGKINRWMRGASQV